MEPGDLTEVFHTDSPIAAQKVLDVLLRPEGIGAVVHERRDRMFPGAGKPGGVYIAVAASDRDRAVALLEEALANGFLEAGEGDVVRPSA
jgi:hypothetical protein